MQIEIYKMTANADIINIQLEAVCDSFSSLLWDVRYYECGSFEIYIAASPHNVEIFQKGRIVGRDDDTEHFGIIETIKLETNAEDGDYLTVSGRFLISLLSRRIIYPPLSFKTEASYADIVKAAVRQNCMLSDNRIIPGLELGTIIGDCWQKTTQLQVSYENLMEWIFKICELISGTANIRLTETGANTGLFKLYLDLSQGTDRSVMQNDNAHIVFSDTYSNLLDFQYLLDSSEYLNYAYILGCGEGAERKKTTHYSREEPSGIERYEVYVDAKDISDEEQSENNETVPIPDADYTQMLKSRGAESLVSVMQKSESTIAANDIQYSYNKDYFIGDYVTVKHYRFGLSQNKIQLIGMIESYDRNGRSLTPTFKGD